MACKGLQPCVISRAMEERWRDGGEENTVEDEFACAGALRGALLSLHPSVKRVFGVTMEIGAEEDAGMPHSGQIWLKLRGRRKDVTASKLFVRGVVNQEEQQEVPYPGVLHCVFCGARGLFLDSLMKNTSAHLVVGSPGFLLISGLTEPVVKAYSLITDLVERYEGTQGRRADGGERGSGESLDSRRAFKSLVEIWEDRHTLDLLVLPGAVKETLLDLVRESGLGVDPVVVGVPEERAVLRDTEHPRGLWETQEAFRFRNHLDQRPLPHAGDPRTQELSTRLPESSERDVENALRPSPFSAGAGGGEGGGEGATVGLGGDGPPLNRLFRSFALRERAEEEEEEGGRGRRMRSPQEVGEEEHRSDEEEVEEEEGERLMSAGSRKELGLLLKFFTTMGYAERVVRRVVSRTGPREASEILDLVQQEQDRSDRQARVRNRPSETEHQEDRGRGGAGGARRGAEGEAEEVGSLVEMEDSEQGRRRSGDRAGREPNMGEVRPLEGPQGRGEEGVDGDDFVLGVLTKAAVSCGYTEEKVVEVYGSLPELSTHQLLLQLQRGGATETEAGGTAERGREGPREVDESVLEVQRPGDSRKGRVGEVERNRAGETPNLSASSGAGEGGLRRNVSRQTHVEEGGGGGRGLSAAVSLTQSDQAQRNVSNRLTTLPPQSNQDPPPFHNSPKRVRGPPQSAYPPTLLFPPASPPKHGPRPTYPLPQPPQPPYLPPQPAGPLPPIQTPNSSTISHPTARDRRVLPAMPSGAVVTGEQRFLEGLQTTFDLQLTVDPGDPGLRRIIIDGSNVAMSHGLGKFFSCRGIALAVQHFWNRGHRQITTFVPQWRSKRDPRVKEQHYLTELQNLGLLSYTPSREVLGKRINSYDDRFMLQLAHKTEGVIVTNDNLRDLLDESHVWTDIIKKRLLQYTFVGDHFMVPDDPLGRGGPHLDHFLHSQHSIPTPGSHSFAGSASSPPRPSRHPRPHTEGLQFRDRTPGVPTGLDYSFGPGQGRRGGQGRGQGPRAERSPADTARLREGLSQVFPDQDSRVILVLQSNPTLTDINSLSHLILEQEEELE